MSLSNEVKPFTCMQIICLLVIFTAGIIIQIIFFINICFEVLSKFPGAINALIYSICVLAKMSQIPPCLMRICWIYF